MEANGTFYKNSKFTNLQNDHISVKPLPIILNCNLLALFDCIPGLKSDVAVGIEAELSICNTTVITQSKCCKYSSPIDS